MTKRYVNSALVYTIIALVSGVFYREFTKLNAFTGKTNLSVIHTHYLVLGMIMFLLFMLIDKSTSFASQKNASKALLFYHIGLNISGISFLIRGILQVLKTDVSSGLDASISGIAGIGHICLGISLVVLLLKIRKVV